MATVFESKGGRPLLYTSGDALLECGTGRPLYYRGTYSNVFYSADLGKPTFWIEPSSKENAERLPLGDTKVHLFRYDGGPAYWFEEEPSVEDIAAKLFKEE